MAYPQIRISSLMTAATATEYVRKMIGREMQGPGDIGPAMSRLEAKYGIPFWSLDHIRKGKAKTVDVGLFARIRGAYLDHCERKLKALEHELRLERARGDDRDQDLLDQVETLLAQVASRRGKA